MVVPVPVKLLSSVLTGINPTFSLLAVAPKYFISSKGNV